MRIVLIAALVTGLAPAAAPASSFEGSCAFSGAVHFDPPMTTTPQPTSQSADAPGTCSGTLVDRRGRTRAVDGVRARYRASSSGDSVSCANGAGVEQFELDTRMQTTAAMRG